MKSGWKMRSIAAPSVLGVLGALAGCSGSTEDVRITLCKNLTTSLLPAGSSIEWTGNQNTFNRPSYAVTGLTFDVTDRDGKRRSMTSACHYAYEALEDTAVQLANPLDAYATLPFAMSLDGSVLTDAQLLRTVNEEQKRLGRKAVATLQQGARDMADKIRAGMGQ